MIISAIPTVSFILGGWLNELYGWRMTFFLMGIPGLMLAMSFVALVAAYHFWQVGRTVKEDLVNLAEKLRCGSGHGF